MWLVIHAGTKVVLFLIDDFKLIVAPESQTSLAKSEDEVKTFVYFGNIFQLSIKSFKFGYTCVCTHLHICIDIDVGPGDMVPNLSFSKRNMSISAFTSIKMKSLFY